MAVVKRNDFGVFSAAGRDNGPQNHHSIYRQSHVDLVTNKKGAPDRLENRLSWIVWASSYAWALAGGKIFAENGARGKPKRDLGGPEASGSGSGAENGQKCLQNDLFGLKMARNGAGSGENGLETTKCAKNAKNGEKMAENEGRTTNDTNGTNGG